MVTLIFMAGAIFAGLAGYFLRRWRFIPALAAIGVVIIAIDISTRDLTSGGHHDRGLVAFTEFALVLGILAVFAADGEPVTRRSGE